MPNYYRNDHGRGGSNVQWGCKACSRKRLDDSVELVERQEKELQQRNAAQSELFCEVVELEAEKTGLAQNLHERMDGLAEVRFQATDRLRTLLLCSAGRVI